METSIIVTTCGDNLKNSLKPCIESIFKFTDMKDVEIIVVASGCLEETKQYLESQSVKFVWFKDKIGYVSAVNEGIKASKGKYIVLLNDDTAVLWGTWLDIFKKPFLEDPKVGITGPLKFFWNCRGVVRNAIGFFCVMIKRTLFDELGLLDEIFNPGMGEDGDFSIKAEMAGYKLVQVPTEAPREFGQGVTRMDFPIYHRGNGTFSADLHKKNVVVDRNTKILEERYGLKEKVPNTLDQIYNICLTHESDINKLFPVLKKYTEECSSVVEMGVRGVFSTYAFLAGRPKKMTSYDIFTSLNINEALEVAKKENIDFKFIEADVLKIEIEETDLLFIDTAHTYEQLSQELKLHSGKVKKYILMHDTVSSAEVDLPITNNEKQGLTLAINEFLLEHKEWVIKEAILESNGLTILERVV